MHCCPKITLFPEFLLIARRERERGLWEGQKRPRRGLSTCIYIAWTSTSIISLAPPTSILYVRIHHLLKRIAKIRRHRYNTSSSLIRQYIQIQRPLFGLFRPSYKPLLFSCRECMNQGCIYFKLYWNSHRICVIGARHPNIQTCYFMEEETLAFPPLYI